MMRRPYNGLTFAMNMDTRVYMMKHFAYNIYEASTMIIYNDATFFLVEMGPKT